MTSYPKPIDEILDAARLRAVFDAVGPLTVGIEEEAIPVEAL